MIPNHRALCVPAVILLLAISMAGCSKTEPRTFDGERAFEHVRAQVEFGYRYTGSEGWEATGEYIIGYLEKQDWEVETQEFEYRGTTIRNIIGRLSPEEGLPVVIIGAHYDTRRSADQEDPSVPVMGANDGASGVAVLLELARILEPDQLRNEVWLAFFDAEDNGHLDGWPFCVGSSYMAATLGFSPQAVIVVDMVGDADQQLYLEQNSDYNLQSQLWDIATALGYGDTFIPEYRWGMYDDHVPFAQRGIPAVDIIDFDYPYWHTTQDTLDKISPQSLERVGQVIEVFLEQ